MNGVDVNILRRKVERILGPLFMRPLRMREITEELSDHALEAAEAGEANPIAALGGARMLRRSIGWSFLAETVVFLVTFLFFYSFLKIVTAGYISLFASFVWIIPSDGYSPPEITLDTYTLLKWVIFVTPALIMAIVLRRWHFLTLNKGWLRWAALIAIVIVLNFVVINFFWGSLNVFNQGLKLTIYQIGSDKMLLRAWRVFLIGLNPTRLAGAQAFVFTQSCLFISIGMLAYSYRKLGLTGRILILLLAAIFAERCDIYYFLDWPKWIHYPWFYVCDAIRNFGWGFWIMFYMNIYDHLWNWFGRMHRDRSEMDLAGE